MNVDRIIHLMAGTLVMLGIALSHYAHPDWIWLSLLVGLNLAQSGITGFCPAAFLLKKAGVKDSSCCT